MLITSDRYLPAYIKFEAVSDVDNLIEMNATRGSNCTSIDALIYGVHKDGVSENNVPIHMGLSCHVETDSKPQK